MGLLTALELQRRKDIVGSGKHLYRAQVEGCPSTQPGGALRKTRVPRAQLQDAAEPGLYVKRNGDNRFPFKKTRAEQHAERRVGRYEVIPTYISIRRQTGSERIQARAGIGL